MSRIKAEQLAAKLELIRERDPEAYSRIMDFLDRALDSSLSDEDLAIEAEALMGTITRAKKPVH